MYERMHLKSCACGRAEGDGGGDIAGCFVFGTVLLRNVAATVSVSPAFQEQAVPDVRMVQCFFSAFGLDLSTDSNSIIAWSLNIMLHGQILH